METNLKDKLKQLIAQGRLQHALELLFIAMNKYMTTNSDKINNRYDEMIMLSGRLNGLLQKVGKGIISNEHAQIEERQITNTFLDYVNGFDDEFYKYAELIPELHNEDELVDIKQDKGSDNLRQKIQSISENQQTFEFDIFLSFSSKDRDFTRPVWETLRGYGLRVFLSDENLQSNAGMSFTQKIQYGLAHSKHLVLVCSQEAMKSEWVTAEWETFFNEFSTKDKDRRLIVLKGPDFDMNLVPLMLRRLQLADNARQILDSLVTEAEILEKEKLKNMKEKQLREADRLKKIEDEQRRKQEVLEKEALEELQNKKTEKEAEFNYWNQAKAQNTENSYRQYLGKYPTGRYASDAKNLLTRLKNEDQRERETEKVKSTQKHPQKTKPKQSKKILLIILIIVVVFIGGLVVKNTVFNTTNNKTQIDKKELLIWKNAKRENTTKAYRQYIANFPKGRYVREAKQIILDLENTPDDAKEETAWQAAKNRNTLSAYQKFIKAFPKGNHYDDAMKAIRILESKENK